MVNQGVMKDPRMMGPLGQYGIAKSQVQTPGWKALESEQGGMMPEGGGGGRGSFRMVPQGPRTTSGFGPLLNLGSGPMAPGAALHQLNLERGKYTAPNMQAYQSTQSGEATARLRHLVSQQQKNRGTMGRTAATYRPSYNPLTGRGGF